jgi:formylglycine-generating enzyme required for sulfatase activity
MRDIVAQLRFTSLGSALFLALVTCCGSDDDAPGASSPGGRTGDASAGTAGGGTGGVGGTGGAAGGMTGGDSGAAGAGGSAATGGVGAAAGSAGMAGSASGGADAGVPDAGGGDSGGASGTGGAAGSGGSGGNVVIVNGGPWPDSLTGACANEAGNAPCPAPSEDYYGQDGTYRISVPSYSATSDTLTDSVTGLMWQKMPSTTAVSQTGAVSYCNNLSLQGHDDWRLPSRLEYVSLIDAGRRPPALPPGLIAAGPHWTSSSTAAAANSSFIVNDSYGLWSVTVNTNQCLPRCVRGPALSRTLQVGADTVVDSMTNLEWQKSALNPTGVSWKAALAYCETLTHASRTDWRLPSIKELATIVDESDATAPAIDETSFGTSTAAYFWSSTPAFTATSDGYAAALQTDLGISSQRRMTDLAAARCVRQAR